MTQELLDRYPDAEVVGIDVSASMLSAASARLAGFEPRIELAQVGLHDDAGLRALGAFDDVISTGTLHWVIDHEAMFTSLAALLPGGGVLVSQSGGEGSVIAVREILTDLGVRWEHLNNYANAEDTSARLERAGFSEIECWMTDEPVTYDDEDALCSYVLSGVIAPYVGDRPEAEQADIARTVVERLDEPVLHFVRLNIRAVAPTS